MRAYTRAHMLDASNIVGRSRPVVSFYERAARARALERASGNTVCESRFGNASYSESKSPT